MTRFKKFLLAGTASIALAGAPVFAVNAADVLGGATGAVSGATSGITGGDASVDTRMEAAGAAAGNPTDLRVGAKGGVSASGAVEEPSDAEIQNSIDAAARDSADAARGMTGGTVNSVTGAASSVTGTTAKGALRNNTEAGVNEGADLRGNVINDTVAQTDADTPPLENPIPELAPASTLTDMGYTGIEPLDSAVTGEGETAFSATNADGQAVNVTVDTRTGAIVSEQPAR